MKKYKVFFILIALIFCMSFIVHADTCISKNVNIKNQLKIDGPANIRNIANGKIIDSLKNNTFVDLINVKGSWVRISYKSNNNQVKSGWTHIQNLPKPALISTNSIPIINSKKLFDIKKKKIDQNNFIYKLYHKQKEIIEINNFVCDEDHYWVFYTSVKDYPYLILFSGHSDDMSMGLSQIVLFGNDKVLINYTYNGNRVDSEFINIENGNIVISEAYHCSIEMRTHFKPTNQGLIRIKSDWKFTNKNKETPFTTVLSYRQRIADENTPKKIILYETSKLDVIKKTFENTKIEVLKALEIDHMYENAKTQYNIHMKRAADIYEKGWDKPIRIIINGVDGWLNNQLLIKLLPEIRDIGCCGCG